MSKRKIGKKANPNKVVVTKRKMALIIAGTLVLLSASGTLAYFLTPSSSPGVAQPLQQSPTLPASLPSKQYIYAGGRMVASEQQQGAPLLSPRPGDLTANAVNGSQISLTWTDGNADEAGFKLERTAGAVDTYMEIANIPVNATSYTDSGLTGTTTYYYRIKAYGTPNGDTEYSNEAQATTLPDNLLLADDYNDNSLNTTKWIANSLASSTTDMAVGVNETNQRLEIGPLLENATGNHFNGLKSLITYDFTGAYCYVQLVQPPGSATGGSAILTISSTVSGTTSYYRIVVSAGTLKCLRGSASGQTVTLASITFDPINHKFLRIRHDSSTNKAVFETAPDNVGVPGKWTQRASDTWSALLVRLTEVRFEVAAGTSAQTPAPGTVIFDNFRAAKAGVPAPTISNAAATNVTNTTATISWNTSQAADSQVEYGLSTSYGNLTTVTDTSPRVTSHSVALSNLQPGTLYHCRVKSRTQTNSLATSGDFTFATPPLPDTIIFADDFDNYSLDEAKWVANSLFSDTADSTVVVNETNQFLQIGPLLQNMAGGHYNGIRSAGAYNFAGAYCYVRLAQMPEGATSASSGLTLGTDVNNNYSIRVAVGSLVCEKKIWGTTTGLFSTPFDSVGHRFLRIRHSSANGQIVFETATENAGQPDGWTQLFAEAWNTSAIPVSALQFELKAGTSAAEANELGYVAFDDFKVARPTGQVGSIPTGAGQTWYGRLRSLVDSVSNALWLG